MKTQKPKFKTGTVIFTIMDNHIHVAEIARVETLTTEAASGKDVKCKYFIYGEDTFLNHNPDDIEVLEKYIFLSEEACVLEFVKNSREIYGCYQEYKIKPKPYTVK
jgi:hypothetical protein